MAPLLNPKIAISEEDIYNWNISNKIRSSEGQLVNDHYFMWETDLRGMVKNHFIIFG